MSSDEGRRVSRQQIQLVRNLIERCLHLYMSQKEVADFLLVQAKIEPSFTDLVWQKLEEENREFFKAYHVRLVVKNQIVMFNQLLEKQDELMNEIQPTGVAPTSLSNGSATSLHQIPLPYISAPGADHPHCSVLPSSIVNGRQPSHKGTENANGTSIDSQTALPRRMLPASPAPSPAPSQGLQMGVLQGMNGAAMKSEPQYSNNTDFPFYSDSSFLDEHHTGGDAPGTSFRCPELGGQPINDPLYPDSSSFGFLSQINRNFSFSDLTDQGADMLETYANSPLLGPENDFSDSPGDNKRFDSISKQYDGFGSDS